MSEIRKYLNDDKFSHPFTHCLMQNFTRSHLLSNITQKILDSFLYLPDSSAFVLSFTMTSTFVTIAEKRNRGSDLVFVLVIGDICLLILAIFLFVLRLILREAYCNGVQKAPRRKYGLQNMF